MNDFEKKLTEKSPKPFARYCGAISSDMLVTVANADALNAHAIDLCTECGCVVYRRDLHDEWHKRTDNPEAKA